MAAACDSAQAGHGVHRVRLDLRGIESHLSRGDGRGRPGGYLAERGGFDPLPQGRVKMRLRRQRPRFTPEQVLLSRPVRNAALETEAVEDGGLRVIIPRRHGVVGAGALLAAADPEAAADRVGRAGPRSVGSRATASTPLRDMIRVFQERHKLSRAEAEWSLADLSAGPGQAGLVLIAVQKPNQA